MAEALGIATEALVGEGEDFAGGVAFVGGTVFDGHGDDAGFGLDAGQLSNRHKLTVRVAAKKPTIPSTANADCADFGSGVQHVGLWRGEAVRFPAIPARRAAALIVRVNAGAKLVPHGQRGFGIRQRVANSAVAVGKHAPHLLDLLHELAKGGAGFAQG
jgi:hypothetical protein